jgi:hypothetical protein
VSRGPSIRGRQIIERLRGAVREDGWPEWVGSVELVRSGGSLTRSRKTYMRDALLRLERRGSIEVLRGRELKARLPLTPKQRQQEQRRTRKALQRLGWPEDLWWWEEHGHLPRRDSRPGRRLVRAGLPPEMLDAEWWEEHSEWGGHDFSNLPAYLRFKPKEPQWKTTRSEEREWRREEHERRRKMGLVKRPASEKSLRQIDASIEDTKARRQFQSRHDPTVRVYYVTPKARPE